MEENRFEKQVRQKMDDLKINPSDAVWVHVNKHIDKRKDRRWILLISLLFIAVLSGSFWFLNSSKESIDKRQEAKNIGSASKTIDSALLNENNNKEKKSVPSSFDQNHIKKITSLKEISAEKNVEESIMKQNVRRKKIESHVPGNTMAIKNIPEQQTNILEEKNNGPDTELLAAKTIDAKNKSNDVKNQINKIDQAGIITKDSIAGKEIVISDKNEKDTAGNITSIKTSTQTHKNKWHWGLIISAGISHVGNQFLGLGYNAADYLQINPTGAGSGYFVSTPSKVKNAGGFIAGVFIEKPIAKKTELSFGINYKAFNTSNVVGQKNDTSGSYSTANNPHRYYNNFHFIEVPVNVRWQLIRSKAFPVFWNGGITLSQLISSNALQFNPYVSATDPDARAYYNDNSFFNKTFIGFNTGLSTAAYANKKLSILVGPYFYYANTRLANEGLYNKKHFVFLGLHTQLIFEKK